MAAHAKNIAEDRRLVTKEQSVFRPTTDMIFMVCSNFLTVPSHGGFHLPPVLVFNFQGEADATLPKLSPVEVSDLTQAILSRTPFAYSMLRIIMLIGHFECPATTNTNIITGNNYNYYQQNEHQ